MDYKNLDDASLIRLIAHNRSEALEELYDRYSSLVFSIAIHSVWDHSIAEEITQDVFYRIWERAKTYNGDLAKVSTWLIAITRNRAIDEIRRMKARPQQTSIYWADALTNNKVDSVKPEDSAELDWQRKLVREALASLPKEQQDALALAYYYGYSHTEIAKALGEPLGTVKTRIRLAMQKLRQILSETAKDSDEIR